MASKAKPVDSQQQKIPLLPLKDVVVFPRMVLPLLVGRPASLGAVEASLASGVPVFLCAQKDARRHDEGSGRRAWPRPPREAEGA